MAFSFIHPTAIKNKLAKLFTQIEKMPPNPAFSTKYMNTEIKPGNNFYEYATGNWTKKIPGDRSAWNCWDEVDERNEYLVHQLLEDAAKNPPTDCHSVKNRVGVFYQSAMNLEQLEKLKFQPIQADLETINKISTNTDLVSSLAIIHKELGNPFFRLSVNPDEKQSERYALYLQQGAYSLPDRNYYLSPEFANQRNEYFKHIKKMFTLSGDNEKSAQESAEIVMSIETELAAACRSREALRDPHKNYNKISTTEFIKNHPSFNWQEYLSKRVNPLPNDIIVCQPEFFAKLDEIFAERPMDEIKTYLRWNVLTNAASYLHRTVRDEHFNFFSKKLNGIKKQLPWWKKATYTIDSCIGEALGKLYVDKHFPAQMKKKMNEIIDNLSDVFKEHLQKLDWMSDVTKEKALNKFIHLKRKVGYPDKFIDYSSIELKSDDYFGNIRRANNFDDKRQMERLGHEVDRNEWSMTPITNNAYYEENNNEIVFPAGILQPPVFDFTMDDAVNYGGIAATIGHEITHGYDDQGRQYDVNGNLENWWTAEDEKEFNKRAQKVVEQYNAYEVLPGKFVNGKLTLGENIADLGAITIAYEALERALDKDPSKRKVIDGLTPEQRFFISYVQNWRSNVRKESQINSLMSDVHAPPKCRAVQPLKNYQGFFDAFHIKENEREWQAPENRVKIW